MDSKESQHFLEAMKDLNEALLDGLRMAAVVLENVDDLPEKKRQEVIIQIRGLIVEGQNAFENISAFQ